MSELFGDYELPEFPSAVLEALRVLREDDSTNAEIARALELDPASSIRLIRLVNSSAFGLRQPVDDLAHAVQLIGRASVESALIASAVGDALPLGGPARLDPDRFWHAAGIRAGIASSLAEQICPSERSICWIAALLQDLAIPLLVDALGERYLGVLQRAAESQRPVHELEQETFGWDHTDIGAAIAESWGLPDALTAAIAGHHDTAAGELPAPLPALLVAPLEIDCADPHAAIAAGAELSDVEPDVLRQAITKGVEEAGHFASMFGR